MLLEPIRRRRSLLAAVCCGWVVLWFPSTAAAQKDIFVQGLLQLNAALAGTYGDEGPQIIAAIDTISRGLAEWDRSIAAFEARVAAETAGTSPDGTVRMRLALARLYIERKRLSDALREIEAVSPLAANPADVHVLRALVLDASGKSDAAREAFRAAWDLDRDDPVKAYYVLRHGASSAEAGQRALDALSRAYEHVARKGTPQTAVTFLHVGLFDDRSAEMATIPHALYAEAYRHIADGEYELAIAQFRRAAADDPLRADPAERTLLMTRAGEALRAKRFAEARAYLEAALLLAPASSEAQRMLGLVYWLNEQDEASIERLETAVRTNPRDERSRLALARVLARAGRDDDAERTLQETVRAIPGSMLAHWWLAADYERLNRIADARHELTLASLSALSGSGTMYAFIGRLSRHAGDFSGAIDALTRGVNARPNDPGAPWRWP
jgi:tetratricopeptide (TPR) repeat protein